jgi:hypothetical protein
MEEFPNEHARALYVNAQIKSIQALAASLPVKVLGDESILDPETLSAINHTVVAIRCEIADLQRVI